MGRKLFRRFFMLLCSIGLALTIVPRATAQTMEDPETRDIHLYREIRGLTEAGPPRVIQGHLVFTYRPSERERRSRFTRIVGLSFAHENFGRVHPYKRLSLSEFASEDLFYYVMEIPENRDELLYRIVVDGVWTADPENPETRAIGGGLRASHFEIPREYRGEMEYPSVADGRIRFVLDLGNGRARFLRTLREDRIAVEEFEGNSVYVAGTFNNWDPFMHPLQPDPTDPGRFVGTIRAPRGVQYYYFVVDGVRVLDPENRELGYAPMTNTRASKVSVP